MVQGISQSGETKSGGAPSQLTATFIDNMLETHVLQNKIQHDLRPAYARRYYKPMEAIETHLPPLGLPASLACDVDHLCQRAREEEAVSVISGSKPIAEEDDTEGQEAFSHNIRLCIAWEDEDLLHESVARLTRIIKGELNSAHS
ncbi:uncharacterized protein PV07_11116 [Cladophialophora immunda]|uniref:Aminotransferase class I/classII domain-containing protein n=1 Tax=Cladophialophora immunda TaxID=569365 RepID=A0A0D2BUX6_9EURO|nr:uncharacterized protein PV07_11116 [Cladophialophora immunda]KIW22863.1 hypothetical protein PV07_11116 [Cladophialophora immunda]